jgi:predicted phosphodiesterase
MRYGIISDVHGNIEAFRAVSDAIAVEGLQRIIFAGDLVGYGADPRACIERMKSLKAHALVAGNHDWGVLGLLDMEYFNESAAEALEWTARHIGANEREYLKSFTLLYEEGDITVVHGSLDQPAKFNYIVDEKDALLDLKLSRTPLCFVGHSHAPGIFRQRGERAEFIGGSAVIMEAGEKYVINVGSVGQPRDGDPRASYAVFDSAEGSVQIKRVGYDTESAGARILKAGLSPWLAARLAEGR